MRILFMGTPDIAAGCLEALYNAGHDICAVYTRRDKPVGRKQVLTAPPVKQLALAHGTPVYQPRTLRDGGEDETIRALAPDVIVVVAYGCILPKSVLEIPPYGCLNLHVSLLPKYRGSAPIQWAVINGDAMTGVTVMQMDEGLDTGDILLTTPVPIGEDETAGELFDRVTEIGAETLCRGLAALEKHALQPMPQAGESSYAPPLDKAMAQFAFDEDALALHNKIRGLNPWPVAYFVFGDKRVKVLKAKAVATEKNVPGTVLSIKPLTIACAKGALQLLQLVPEGGKPVDGTAFAAGRRMKVGDTL